jgi:hypothetical protein
VNELAGALAKAQEAMPPIPRNRKVVVKLASGGSYDFMYAPLDTILDACRPVLGKNGLSLSQLLSSDDKGMTLITVLLHSSGQWLRCWTRLPSTPIKPQELGGVITYMRRYAVQCILGVAAEDDDDANGETNSKPPAQRSPHTVTPAKPQEPPVVDTPGPKADAPPPAKVGPPAAPSAKGGKVQRHVVVDNVSQLESKLYNKKTKDAEGNYEKGTVWSYVSTALPGVKMGCFDETVVFDLQTANETHEPIEITYEDSPSYNGQKQAKIVAAKFV